MSASVRREGPDTVTIRSRDGSASFTVAPDHGARGTSLVLPRDGAPTELLFLRETFWDTDRNTGGWPVLFPVCGRHRIGERMFVYERGGVERPMPMHGFGPSRPWRVVAREEEAMTLALEDDAATRELFPFCFRVQIRFQIEPARLRIAVEVENRGSEPMPLAMGFHPYFTLDPAAGPWTLDGAFSEVGRYDPTYTEVLRWDAVVPPVDALEAARADAVFPIDATRPFLLARAGRPWITLTANAPGDTLRFPYLQLYRSADDPFLCLEPWMDLPNALNRATSVPRVPPGVQVVGHTTVE